jgi:hypothetical protein
LRFRYELEKPICGKYEEGMMERALLLGRER